MSALANLVLAFERVTQRALSGWRGQSKLEGQGPVTQHVPPLYFWAAGWPVWVGPVRPQVKEGVVARVNRMGSPSRPAQVREPRKGGTGQKYNSTPSLLWVSARAFTGCLSPEEYV